MYIKQAKERIKGNKEKDKKRKTERNPASQAANQKERKRER